MRKPRAYNLDRCTIGGSVREREIVDMLNWMLDADPLNDRRVKHLLTFIEIQYSKINILPDSNSTTLVVFYRNLLGADFSSRSFPELLAWFESKMTDIPHWIHLFHITRSVVVAKLRSVSRARIRMIEERKTHERKSREPVVPAVGAEGDDSPEDEQTEMGISE